LPIGSSSLPSSTFFADLWDYVDWTNTYHGISSNEKFFEKKKNKA